MRTGDDAERQRSSLGIRSGERDRQRSRAGCKDGLRIRRRRMTERAVDRQMAEASDENVAREERTVSFHGLIEDDRAARGVESAEYFARLSDMNGGGRRGQRTVRAVDP